MLRQTARLAARRRATATRALSTEYAFDEPKSTTNWPVSYTHLTLPTILLV